MPHKISFDFDGCLDANEAICDLAKLYISAGRSVYILTARSPEPYRNHDLYTIADDVGIPREKILFAWDSSKPSLIKENAIELHYDNDPHVIHQINHECGPKVGILIHYQYISNDLGDETY